jgi:hypothetical protein
MKILKLLLLMAVILSGVTSGFAQQSKPAGPPPPPPPARDYFPSRWEEFASTEGRFKILFPGTPQETSQAIESPSGKIIVHLIKYRSLLDYQIFYIDYLRDMEDPATLKPFLDSVRDKAIQTNAGNNPKIVKEVDVSTGGHPGRLLKVELGKNTVVWLKSVAVKNRVYSLTAITPKERPETMGSKNDYEEIVMSFFDSFQLQ